MRIQLNQELTNFIKTCADMAESTCRLGGCTSARKRIDDAVETLFFGTTIAMAASTGCAFLALSVDDYLAGRAIDLRKVAGGLFSLGIAGFITCAVLSA